MTSTANGTVARFVAIGLLLMSFFTALWAAWVPYGLSTAVAVVIVVVFLTVSAVLAVNGVALLRSAARIPAPTPDRTGRGRALRIGFGIVFGSEGAVIAIVCALLGAHGHDDYIGPAIALIVGLHFIPFGFLFRRRIDFYIGAWVALWATVGIVAIAAGTVEPRLATSLVAVTTAVGTTSYGVYFLGVKKAMMRSLADSAARSAHGGSPPGPRVRLAR